MIRPDLTYEFELRGLGVQTIAGLDEAGRGALAGPVVAAAVVLPLDAFDLAGELESVRDSKRLSAGQRERCEGLIRAIALFIGIGHATHLEIDEAGILPSTRLAMCRALQALPEPPDHLLIDHIHLPELPHPQTSITRGDAKVLSIAAASIIAKQSRDRMMIALDHRDPRYGFAKHKGYATQQHRSALDRFGPSPDHRRSFSPVRETAQATLPIPETPG